MADCVKVLPVEISDETTIEAVFQGAKNDAKFAEVAVTENDWTLLTNLTLGQAVNIQNPEDSNGNVKLNWLSPSQPSLELVGYVGMLLKPDQERFYSLSTGNDNIQVYAKAEPGSGGVTLNVEQLG